MLRNFCDHIRYLVEGANSARTYATDRAQMHSHKVQNYGSKYLKFIIQ